MIGHQKYPRNPMILVIYGQMITTIPYRSAKTGLHRPIKTRKKQNIIPSREQKKNERSPSRENKKNTDTIKKFNGKTPVKHCNNETCNYLINCNCMEPAGVFCCNIVLFALACIFMCICTSSSMRFALQWVFFLHIVSAAGAPPGCVSKVASRFYTFKWAALKGSNNIMFVFLINMEAKIVSMRNQAFESDILLSFLNALNQ